MADLLMPKLGLTMTEGLLTEWRVEPGRPFSAGDVLFIVETEKVATEIEAERDGTVAKILVQTGETVPVGSPVAVLTDARGDDSRKGQERAATPAAPDTVAPDTVVPDTAAPDSASGTSRDAPSARKLIAEHALDSSEIQGTGRGGRITKVDVLRVIATPYARKLAASRGIDLASLKGTGPAGRIKAADLAAVATPPSTRTAMTVSTPVESVPDAARLATARRVSAAKRDIPHFTLSDEVETGGLSALRAQLNAEPGRTRISVTHLVIAALGRVLTAMPEVNRIWCDEKILAFSTVDIGMVTETPQGLRIPVVRDVGRQTLDEVATQATALAHRARDNTLAAGDVGGGAIAISNVGMFGVTSISPIINPPQALILGVGAERALFRPDAHGAPVARREIILTLACDHRIIDGALAARFLHTVVETLEAPYRLLRAAPAADASTERAWTSR